MPITGAGSHCELERLHRLRDALQLEAAEGVEAVVVARARELAHQGVDHDLPAVRVGAQPRRLDDRLTEVVAVLDRGLPEAHADAHAELLLCAAVARLDRLLHLNRARQ